jgi:hypothetical protein
VVGDVWLTPSHLTMDSDNSTLDRPVLTMFMHLNPCGVFEVLWFST